MFIAKRIPWYSSYRTKLLPPVLMLACHLFLHRKVKDTSLYKYRQHFTSWATRMGSVKERLFWEQQYIFGIQIKALLKEGPSTESLQWESDLWVLWNWAPSHADSATSSYFAKYGSNNHCLHQNEINRTGQMWKEHCLLFQRIWVYFTLSVESAHCMTTTWVQSLEPAWQQFYFHLLVFKIYHSVTLAETESALVLGYYSI